MFPPWLQLPESIEWLGGGRQGSDKPAPEILSQTGTDTVIGKTFRQEDN
jgi:hypothetical protein